MLLGVVSDTHGLLRPELLAALGGIDHIIHAGDIGSEAIVPGLRRIAPVSAIRGNIDHGAWAAEFPAELDIEFERHRILVLHDIGRLRSDAAAAGYAMVVFGHSHQPSVERSGALVRLNPGAAGPRRFRLPVTFATVAITRKGRIDPQIHHLLPAASPDRSREAG